MNEALEKLLRNPRVWRASCRGGEAGGKSPGLATGYPALDGILPGGGWPRGALTEILLQDHGIGELELLMPALACLSNPEAPGEEEGWVAWISPPFQPYPPALLQWGVNLSRMLVVHSTEKDALWAAEQALAGGCAAVLVWTQALNDAAGRRLQLAAEKGQGWAVAFCSGRGVKRVSAAALRIELQGGEQGMDIHVLKSRGGRSARITAATAFPAGPNG